MHDVALFQAPHVPGAAPALHVDPVQVQSDRWTQTAEDSEEHAVVAE